MLPGYSRALMGVRSNARDLGSEVPGSWSLRALEIFEFTATGRVCLTAGCIAKLSWRCNFTTFV